MTKEQKSQLIKEFTRAASETTKIPVEAFIVLLQEMDSDNVDVGGEMLSERQKGR